MGTSLQRRQLRQRTRGLLQELGADDDDVARKLESMGVTGTPGDEHGCAVAAYLSAIVPTDPQVVTVLVKPRHVVLDTAEKGRPARVRLPRPLRLFVARFDRGAYPALVRPQVPVGTTDSAAAS